MEEKRWLAFQFRETNDWAEMEAEISHLFNLDPSVSLDAWERGLCRDHADFKGLDCCTMFSVYCGPCIALERAKL